MKKREYLLNSYVRQNGKIFPFGMIRIFANDVVDNPSDNSIGLPCWSSELVPYGGGDYYAKIDNNEVVVFSKIDDQRIAVISEDNLIMIIDIYISKVEKMGYLNTIGSFGQPLFERSALSDHFLKALEIVAAGKPAPFFDNSSFVKVAKKLIGSELILLCMEGSHYKVIDSNGLQIKSRIVYPLHEKKVYPLHEKKRKKFPTSRILG